MDEAKNYNDAIEFCKQMGSARLFEPRFNISSDFFNEKDWTASMWIGINFNSEGESVYASNGEKITPILTPIDTSLFSSRKVDFVHCIEGVCYNCIGMYCYENNCVAGQFSEFFTPSVHRFTTCDETLPFICEIVPE